MRPDLNQPASTKPGAIHYKHSTKGIVIQCKRHGPFTQKPYQHWAGKGCPACGREARALWAAGNVLTTKEILQRFRRIHADRYDYSNVQYHRYNARVEISCPKHGAFKQTPQAHLEGKGCPHCAQSSGEVRVALWLRERAIPYEAEWRLPIPVSEGGRLWGRFDFYLPHHRLFIEVDGPHHFAPVRYAGMSEENALRVHEATVRRDQIKDSWAASQGLAVKRIRWEADIEAELEAGHLTSA